MDIKDLKSLIAAGESQAVEFKTAFSNEAVETIAAFSNTSGGTVFLGVADNAQIIGLNLTAEKNSAMGKRSENQNYTSHTTGSRSC